MAAFVFGLHPRIELHLEREFFGHQVKRSRRSRRQTIGSAMTMISSRPMKIDMTMPGHVEQPQAESHQPHDEGGEHYAHNAAGAAQDARRRQAPPW